MQRDELLISMIMMNDKEPVRVKQQPSHGQLSHVPYRCDSFHKLGAPNSGTAGIGPPALICLTRTALEREIINHKFVITVKR